jgi:hypothetical protein
MNGSAQLLAARTTTRRSRSPFSITGPSEHHQLALQHPELFFRRRDKSALVAPHMKRNEPAPMRPTVHGLGNMGESHNVLLNCQREEQVAGATPG